MSNTLGDELYDLISDAVGDVVSAANRKEEEYQDQLTDLEDKITELEQEIANLKEQE
jgi:cell division protein FtsB